MQTIWIEPYRDPGNLTTLFHTKKLKKESIDRWYFPKNPGTITSKQKYPWIPCHHADPRTSSSVGDHQATNELRADVRRLTAGQKAAASAGQRVPMREAWRGGGVSEGWKDGFFWFGRKP